MIKNTFSCFVLLLFLGIQTTLAQDSGPVLNFEDSTHDFGAIQEADGKVTHVFSFTNTGDSPLVITRVVASCGCTTNDWTKQPVAPGQKGFVDATFDPKNRPGQFNKIVTVSSNAKPSNTVLRIKGEVIAKVPTMEDLYPYKIGQIRMKSNHIPFAKVYRGQSKTLLTEVINDSDQPVEISLQGIPAHLSVSLPGKLAPGEKGVIEVSYDPDKKNDWGFVTDRLRILQNGQGENNQMLTISATISEDFSSLSEEDMENAPLIQFDESNFDFGNMEQNAKVEHEYTFTNAGKSDLVIRKVSSSCGCTAVKPADDVIKPGQTSSIKAIFSSGTRKGRQNKTVTVVTNDPKNSQIMLRLNGNVVVNENK